MSPLPLDTIEIDPRHGGAGARVGAERIRGELLNLGIKVSVLVGRGVK